ncbi:MULTISPECIES: CPBP family intramembrane glutamic endopeptidase [unclassified Thioalkalivibrio]|uniref:CPBP family intramembrane glutamic endopeptidase n=1 Tax=unclassified Thioalkalivibrio TaxID=2621013 RepID=UPI00035D7090|nr:MULTISPECIES: CPBP family intramembrane glutamic endopeptidase [unclassified Thioalkalivibrio]
MSLRQAVARHPLLAGLAFQAALIPLALILARVAGIPLDERIDWSLEAAALGILAVLPMLMLLGTLAISGWEPYRALADQVRDFVHQLFRHALPGAVLLIAILAGVGEELLVRGVLQGWLTERWSPEWAIVAAAIVFGLAHSISRLYFVFATVIGLYLGLLYHLTGNLLVVIVTHALYDWIVIHWYLRSRDAGRRGA